MRSTKRLQDHPNALAVGDRVRWLSHGVDRALHGGVRGDAEPEDRGADQLPARRARRHRRARAPDRFDPDERGRRRRAVGPVAGRSKLCDGDSPIAPPLLPEDRKQRDAIIRVRAELAALRADPETLVAKHDATDRSTRRRSIGSRSSPRSKRRRPRPSQVLGDYELARTRFDRGRRCGGAARRLQARGDRADRPARGRARCDGRSERIARTSIV